MTNFTFKDYFKMMTHIVETIPNNNYELLQADNPMKLSVGFMSGDCIWEIRIKDLRNSYIDLPEELKKLVHAPLTVDRIGLINLVIQEARNRKMEDEICLIDNEGFAYWLTNFFKPDNSPFTGETLEKFKAAAKAMREAEDALDKVKEELGIDF